MCHLICSHCHIGSRASQCLFHLIHGHSHAHWCLSVLFLLSFYFLPKFLFHLFLLLAMVPSDSMNNPLCHSAIGSMVTFDYCTPDTLCARPGSRQGVEGNAELSRSLWFSPCGECFLWVTGFGPNAGALEPRGWQPRDIGTAAANSRAPTQRTADRVRSCGLADQLSDQVPQFFFYTDLDGKLSVRGVALLFFVFLGGFSVRFLHPGFFVYFVGEVVYFVPPSSFFDVGGSLRCASCTGLAGWFPAGDCRKVHGHSCGVLHFPHFLSSCMF